MPLPLTRILRPFAAILTALTLLTLVTACGFQLRGAVDIPSQFSPVFVDAPPSSAVGALIRDRLQMSGVKLASSAKEGRALVRILAERRHVRVGALDRNGKVIASEIFLQVRFEARDASGKTLVEASGLELSRIFENPDVEVLGKQMEAEVLYGEMSQDIATQILAMLRAALPHDQAQKD